MADLPVVVYNNPTLKKKSHDVEELNDEIREFIDDMFDTMYENEGIGLAAVQVDRLLNLFVLNIDQDPEKDIDGTEEVFINPKVLKNYGDLEESDEGCLSVPEIRAKVKRKSLVDVEYTDLNGDKKIEENISGLRGRAILHEMDHLNGMTFIDRLGATKKLFLKSQLKALDKEYNS